MTVPGAGLAVRLEEAGPGLRLLAAPGDDAPLAALADALSTAQARGPERLVLAWEGNGPFLAPLVPRPPEEDLPGWLAAGRDLVRRLGGLRFPVVAELSGLIAGPPLELALACSARVATRDSLLGFPDVQAGTLPGWGGLERAVALTGPTRALEWLLSGAALPAAMARGWGLVDEVVAGAPELPAAAARARGRGARWPLPDRMMRWLPFLRRMAFSRFRLRAVRLAPEPALYPAPHRIVRLVELTLLWPAEEVAEQVREAVLEAARSTAARELPRLAGGGEVVDPDAVIAPVIEALRRALPADRVSRRRVLAEMIAWGFAPAALGRVTGEERLIDGLARGRGAALLLSLASAGVRAEETSWYPVLLDGVLQARARAGEGTPAEAIDRLIVRKTGWPAWRGGPLAALSRLGADRVAELLARAGGGRSPGLAERPGSARA